MIKKLLYTLFVFSPLFAAAIFTLLAVPNEIFTDPIIKDVLWLVGAILFIAPAWFMWKGTKLIPFISNLLFPLRILMFILGIIIFPLGIFFSLWGIWVKS